jgi:hypothetical protein
MEQIVLQLVVEHQIFSFTQAVVPQYLDRDVMLELLQVKNLLMVIMLLVGIVTL